jgi:hypothetical protein
MYCGEMESKYISLAWKLGLHPSTLAHLTAITSSLPKYVFCDCHKLVGALQVTKICFLNEFWKWGRRETNSIDHRSCSSIQYCSIFSKLDLDQPKCSLQVFCDSPKLFDAFQAIQICLIIALGTRGQENMNSIPKRSYSSTQYSSSLQN